MSRYHGSPARLAAVNGQGCGHVFAEGVVEAGGGRDLAPYVVYMQDPANGFRSSTLHLADGTEFSVRV